MSTVSVDSPLLVKRWIFSASAPKISANLALMPPKESLFSTLRKTVVFFRLTRTYLREDAGGRDARAVAPRRRFARRPPQLWCLGYLDTARHICGDAIEAQGCMTYGAAVGDYVSAEPRPKILRAQRYGSKGCDLSRPSVSSVDV